MNLEKYNVFIEEQKDFFEKNIKKQFNDKWEDLVWHGGTKGSGWLKSRSGKTYLNFSTITRLEGVDNQEVNQIFQIFMKSVLILSYRKSNMKASPQKLLAELLILKRWYATLNAQNNEYVHPINLSTLILNESFKVLIENSSKTNLPDHAGTYLRLQEMLKHYSFTELPLKFSEKYLYINKKNRTRNAQKTKALIDQLELDENELDTDKLISIRTFINIVSLISLCQTNGEKIILNLLLLLIITGFRSTEAILLKTDALIKRPILDPKTKEHLTLDGIKQYTLGIQYHGAKGSGLRIHWVEPSSTNLVETIFQSVMDLTQEYREHLYYIRSKNCTNFLPKAIDEIDSDMIEINDFIGIILEIKQFKRGNAGQRGAVTSAINKIPIHKEIRQGSSVKKYYLKNDVNNFIKSLTNYASEYPIDYVFNYEGGIEKIPFEELLFIHEYRSTNLRRSFSFKANIIPLSVIIINNCLGSTQQTSFFQKYNLLENEKEYSKLTSHIPRHNINTFLALSGLAEHLQTILMGRVDVRQNQYYQHLALKQSKVAASILEKHELTIYKEIEEIKLAHPVDVVKKDGLMYFSENLDFETRVC